MALSETEAKLVQYRAKRDREKRIQNYQSAVTTFFSSLTRKSNKTEATPQDQKDYEKLPLSSTDSSSDTEHDNQPFEDENPSSFNVYDYLLYTLIFLLWATLYAIFIKLQFGVVYLIISALVGMYLNTRTRPKRKNEVSAYSVFNKNCESIDGTLDGEQMTKQMLYGGFAR